MSLFYIIAAGESFIDVTEDEWNYLCNKHTISFTRVPYGSRKTEYWFSIEREYIDEAVLRYMVKLGNTDTKLLLYLPESIQLARKMGFKSIRKIRKETFYFMPSRRPWFIDEPNPPHKFSECRAYNFHQPIFRFRGQLIAVVNACLILGATEIRLIGVDLNNQANFYDTDYLEKCCKDKETIQKYKEHVKLRHQSAVETVINNTDNYNPETCHSTNIPLYEKDRWGNRQLRGVADILQWINSEMIEEGMEGIFTTSKNSLLYIQQKLRYKTIMEK